MSKARRKLTEREAKAISKAMFDRLDARPDPVKALEAKIGVNKFVAKKCREDAELCRSTGDPRLAQLNEGLAKGYDFTIEEDEQKLAKLKEQSHDETT